MMLRVFTTLLFAALQVTAFTFERIDRDNSAVLIIDHQVGLMGSVRDTTPEVMYNNILLHATLGKVYNLPVVITTSTDQGPNGPLLPEISEMYPNVTVIRRGGEIDAWDNADFRAAVKATGKKQVIVGGITTDVCTMLVCLSLLEAGFTVFANADASGASDARTADLANARMRQAGVYVIPQGSVVSDLQRDWRNPPGVAGFLQLLFKFFPILNNIVRQHAGAITTGVLAPGEDALF